MDATLRKQYTTKKKIGTGTFQYLSRFLLEVLTRFELVNDGFADRCLTTWLQTHIYSCFRHFCFLDFFMLFHSSLSNLFDTHHSICYYFQTAILYQSYYNIKISRELSSANVEAAASYLEDLAQITDKGGYTKQKNFNVDETALHGNKML